jgi:hypothetical protein
MKIRHIQCSAMRSEEGAYRLPRSAAFYLYIGLDSHAREGISFNDLRHARLIDVGKPHPTLCLPRFIHSAMGHPGHHHGRKWKTNKWSLSRNIDIPAIGQNVGFSYSSFRGAGPEPKIGRGSDNKQGLLTNRGVWLTILVAAHPYWRGEVRLQLFPNPHLHFPQWTTRSFRLCAEIPYPTIHSMSRKQPSTITNLLSG